MADGNQGEELLTERSAKAKERREPGSRIMRTNMFFSVWLEHGGSGWGKPQ